MVIWIKFTDSHPFSSLVPKMSMFTLGHIRFTLIHGPNIPYSFAILFFTASDSTFTTRHIHNWASFLRWPRCFILSRTISNCCLLFPSSILGAFWPRGFIFWCHIFLPFHDVCEVLESRILEWLPFPPPGDLILSELFTMICPSWVALHGMAHSFIELQKPLHHEKAVIYEEVFKRYGLVILQLLYLYSMSE